MDEVGNVVHMVLMIMYSDREVVGWSFAGKTLLPDIRLGEEIYWATKGTRC